MKNAHIFGNRKAVVQKILWFSIISEVKHAFLLKAKQ